MSTETEMVLTESVFENATVLLTKGTINSSNAKLFGEKLNRLIQEGCEHLVVDLSDVIFMTSAGFRALLVAGKTASKSDSKFSLCGLNEDVHRLFELGGFIDLFPIYNSSNDALQQT